MMGNKVGIFPQFLRIKIHLSREARVIAQEEKRPLAVLYKP